MSAKASGKRKRKKKNTLRKENALQFKGGKQDGSRTFVRDDFDCLCFPSAVAARLPSRCRCRSRQFVPPAEKGTAGYKCVQSEMLMPGGERGDKKW